MTRDLKGVFFCFFKGIFITSVYCAATKSSNMTFKTSTASFWGHDVCLSVRCIFLQVTETQLLTLVFFFVDWKSFFSFFFFLNGVILETRDRRCEKIIIIIISYLQPSLMLLPVNVSCLVVCFDIQVSWGCSFHRRSHDLWPLTSDLNHRLHRAHVKTTFCSSFICFNWFLLLFSFLSSAFCLSLKCLVSYFRLIFFSKSKLSWEDFPDVFGCRHAGLKFIKDIFHTWLCMWGNLL